MFNRYFIFQSDVLMFFYVEQDVNLAKQSCSGLEKLKMALKIVKNPGKSCLAVGKEWVNGLSLGPQEKSRLLAVTSSHQLPGAPQASTSRPL